MTNLIGRAARGVYRRLPATCRSAIQSVWVARSYHLNTKGARPNSAALRWFAEHGRPVSIVIPSYNDVPLLREALASIAETCAGVDYEVIIVDDYINDAVSAELQTFESPRTRVVLKDKRLGFAGTVNVGMALAQHDIVLLNSDIVAKEGWLQALQHAAYAVDPAIGLVSAKLIYPNGRIQYGGTYYARLLAPQWFGHLHVGSPATKATANIPGYNLSMSGACAYITRRAFEVLGPLDDGFWLGFEDVDYGLRAWSSGIRCYYEPAALLVHHESASRGYSQGYRELASMRRFWNRWQANFLTRQADGSVHVVTSARAHPVWNEYVGMLCDGLRATGTDVTLHQSPAVPGEPDEGLVTRLRGSKGVIVACDESVAETAWLATVNSGTAAYLLPAMESVLHPGEPATQSRIVAGYRPDFDYIAPNRWTQRQLQAETAWEARFRISPAIAPLPLPTESSNVIVMIGADDQQRAAATLYARGAQLRVEHVDPPRTPSAVADIRALLPRVIVDLCDHQNSLVPFALMSVGAVYVAPTRPQLSHDVLDGYNALLFDAGDTNAMIRSIADSAEHDEVWRELRANSYDSAGRAAGIAQAEFVRAIASFATTPM